MSTTIERRQILRADLFPAETAYDDELSIHYGCGEWESVLDPAEFADMARWHRIICPECLEVEA